MALRGDAHIFLDIFLDTEITRDRLHGSRVTGHGSRVTGHGSRVTGHGSRVTPPSPSEPAPPHGPTCAAPRAARRARRSPLKFPKQTGRGHCRARARAR